MATPLTLLGGGRGRRRLPVGQILGPDQNTGTTTVFGRIVVMITENVCSALKWGADTLEERTHVRNIRHDDKELPVI
jgi:hypothetical protein